jgi:hypothetical protein
MYIVARMEDFNVRSGGDESFVKILELMSEMCFFRHDLPVAMRIWSLWMRHPSWQWPSSFSTFPSGHTASDDDPSVPGWLFRTATLATGAHTNADAVAQGAQPIVTPPNAALAQVFPTSLLIQGSIARLLNRMALPTSRQFYGIQHRPSTRAIIALLQLAVLQATAHPGDTVEDVERIQPIQIDAIRTARFLCHTFVSDKLQIITPDFSLTVAKAAVAEVRLYVCVCMCRCAYVFMCMCV